MLHRPNIIVLDEATAALDSPSQDRLMALLSHECKDATIVSIGHRPELARFHQRKILLEHSPRGAKLVNDVDRTAKSGCLGNLRVRIRNCRTGLKVVAGDEAGFEP
jgi:vitamin B12/bleomycin/antimicrobial peptide transport system ATP-binding/permease protein